MAHRARVAGGSALCRARLLRVLWPTYCDHTYCDDACCGYTYYGHTYQVGVHCAERGALLQRIRKFFGSALRWSRNGDAAKQA